jgi:hypothetical protein
VREKQRQQLCLVTIFFAETSEQIWAGDTKLLAAWLAAWCFATFQIYSASTFAPGLHFERQARVAMRETWGGGSLPPFSFFFAEGLFPGAVKLAT